jgi:ABC-type lipoprotein export system ATPase subunit
MKTKTLLPVNFFLSAEFIVLSLILVCECLSVSIIPFLLSKGNQISLINIFLFCVLLVSISTHFITPYLIYKLSLKLRNFKYSRIYNLRDIRDYSLLDKIIQKDEQIFLNNIQSKIYLILRLIQVVFILIATLIATKINGLIIFIFILFILLLYKFFVNTINKLNNTNLSNNFLLITKIRRIGSLISKSIFYNENKKISQEIDNIYSRYYQNLAIQSSLSNGFRSVVELIFLFFSLFYFLYIKSPIDLKFISILSYAALKIVPYLQQANFYMNIINSSSKIESQIFSVNSKVKIRQDLSIQQLINSNKNLWFVGDSGSGKSVLLDAIAAYMKKNSYNFCYYVQNQRPMHFSFDFKYKHNISNWMPKRKKLSFSEIISDRVSQGEFQRLALAEMLSRNYKYVILDEPFSSQSLNYIKEISKTINILSSNGTIFFIASHVDVKKHIDKIYIKKIKKIE